MDTTDEPAVDNEAEKTRAALLRGVRQAKLAMAVSCGVRGHEMPESVQADPLAQYAYHLGMTFVASVTTTNGDDALLLMEAMTRYLGHGPLCLRSVYIDELWPHPRLSSAADPDEPDAPPEVP